MSELLLIHGSCHGAWCWRDVLAELEALDQPARAIDLPAHGRDRTPATEVTLHTYAEAIVAQIEAPVVLVGHSMGGFPITAAALLAPEKIRALVYVAAYIPNPGRSHAQMRFDWHEQPLADAIERPGDGTFHFRDEKLEPLFYHDCPAGTLELAKKHLTPEPIAPGSDALSTIPAHPRHAILCSEDRVIPPAYQAHMANALPPENVQTLATGHSPFFAAPALLAKMLANIAKAA